MTVWPGIAIPFSTSMTVTLTMSTLYQEWGISLACVDWPGKQSYLLG